MAVRSFDAKINGMAADFFTFPNQDYVAKELINAFSFDEKVTVTVKTRRKPRSLAQNSLFHAYCGIIADETGNSLESVKSTLKMIYAQKPMLDKEGEVIYNKDTGEQLNYIQDTSSMNTEEMFILTENTRAFALEWFGMNLPLPDEQETLKFK